ncbi:MAG: hypothetical protein SO155_02575 [Candidatus Ventricola sp.]|nr:hypothetical protein [Candidatus Ventricola sp.]
MKRIRKMAMLVLMAAMLCLCAAAEALAAASQAQNLTGETIIQPEPIALSMDALAGKTVMVRVGAYHQEDHTLELTILEKLRFAAEAVEGLQPGDALDLDGELLVVREIEPMTYLLLLDDGSGVDEASVWLKKGEDGDYEAERYSHPIWRTVGSAPFAVANDAQFLDGIDPEDGDMLESPTRHSMEEFLRIKEEEEERGYPGFGCDNVWAAFNAEGEIASLERFYVPWQ